MLYCGKYRDCCFWLDPKVTKKSRLRLFATPFPAFAESPETRYAQTDGAPGAHSGHFALRYKAKGRKGQSVALRGDGRHRSGGGGKAAFFDRLDYQRDCERGSGSKGK